MRPEPTGANRADRPARGVMLSHHVGQVRGVLAERVVISTWLDPFLSLRALATYSGLSVRTLRAYLDLPPDEALPCFRLPGKVVVRKSEYDAWIQRFRTRGRPSLVMAICELGLSASTVP